MGMTITTRRLDPAEAEVVVETETGVSIAGRFMGPRCRYAGTVEVAYYLRPRAEGGARAVIPEPSYWEPETPFLYEAKVEIGGAMVRTRHGLRTIALTSAGLRLNGRPFRIDGVVRRELTDASALRAIGVNTILCPVTPETVGVWDAADEWGFLVLGEVAREAGAIALARGLSGHASCLGWIPSASDLEADALPGTLLGWRWRDNADSPPTWAKFLVIEETAGAPELRVQSVAETADTVLGTIRV